MIKIDVSGKDCPIPLFELQKAISSNEVGNQIALTFTCPEAIKNIGNYCKKSNIHIDAFDRIGKGRWQVIVHS